MKFDRIGTGPRWRTHAARITAREYVPFAAWILSWAALTAALGVTVAVLLMAANGFVQAVRSLFLMQSFDALAARRGCPPGVKSRARRMAVGVDLAVLLACLAILLPSAVGLDAIGLDQLAVMILIVALGLPARTPVLLALHRRRIGTAWRIGSSAAMLAGAAVVLLLGLPWPLAALVLALREWGGLFGAWLSRPVPDPAPAALAARLGFAEIASRTSFAARRRLVYRIGKIMLGVFGPFGSLLARTGRGAGLDGRLAGHIPASRPAIALLAALSAASVAAIMIASREPAALLLASVLARVAAAALSTLIWWPWGEAAGFAEWLDDDL